MVIAQSHSRSPGKRRIALVCNSLLRYAGVERRTMDLARFLISNGYEVAILVLRENGPVAAEFEKIGATVRLINVYDYLEKEGIYRFHPMGLLQLHCALWRFGAVICVQPPSYIFARIAALPVCGRKVVAMERFLIGERSKRRLLLDKILAQLTTGVVCVSTLLKNDLVAKSGIPSSRVHVIEDGVAIEPPTDPQNGIRAWINGRFVFGYVGLLEERKRPAQALEAFAQLQKSNPLKSSVLLFVGTGEDEAGLKRRCSDLRLDDLVLFAGEQQHPHDFYPLFNAFVFPSVKEGLGNVWAEAMMHSLPVICADVPPMSDYLVHEETSLLCPPDDTNALSQAMSRLLDSPALCVELGRRGKAYAYRTFDRDQQLKKLMDLVG